MLLQLAQALPGTVGVFTTGLLVHTLLTLCYVHLFYSNTGQSEGSLAFPSGEQESVSTLR